MWSMQIMLTGNFMAGTAFAVRACNMNGLEFVLRIAQGFTQKNGIGNIFFNGRGAHATEHR